MSGITRKANYFSNGHCLQHTFRNGSQLTRNEPEYLPFHLVKKFSRFAHQVESYEALKLPGRYYPNLPYLPTYRTALLLYETHSSYNELSLRKRNSSGHQTPLLVIHYSAYCQRMPIVSSIFIYVLSTTDSGQGI